MDAIGRRRRKFLWCDICHKFNHNTNNCFKNEDNWSIEDEAGHHALPVEDLNVMNNQAASAEGINNAEEGQEGVV